MKVIHCDIKKQKTNNQRHKVTCLEFLLSSSEHDYHVSVWASGKREGRRPEGREEGRERQCICLSPLSMGHNLVSFRARSCARLDLTHDDTVLPDVNVRTNLCCIDHTVLLDEYVITNVKWEERHSER